MRTSSRLVLAVKNMMRSMLLGSSSLIVMDWMMGHFQVLFSGQVVEGAIEATVRHNLSRALALDERKVAQLFSGRTVVIRNELSREEAAGLQEELAAFGAVARIKDASPDEKAKFKIDGKSRDQTLNEITAAHIECVRCGHLQLEAEYCARCGVDIATAQKLKRKEDLLIKKKIRGLKGQPVSTPPAALPQVRANVSDETIQPIQRRPAGHRDVTIRPRQVASKAAPLPSGSPAGNHVGNPFGGGFWRKLLNPSRKDERSP